MGIDKTTEEAEKEQILPERADRQMPFSLTLNPSVHTMKLIAISRDTMTEIDTYDRQEIMWEKAKNHLALAYAFGDGAKRAAK